MQKKQMEAGIIPSDAIVPTERDLLKLKRQVAALDAGQAISFTATEVSAPAASTEADEVRRIQALIKDSPDLINAPDRKGQTLLQSAAAKGKLALVKLLLDSGAAVDSLQQPGLTALHYAAANGHKAVVDLLLSKGAKRDAQNVSGVTPLHLATLKGYETVAKALVAAGAPVNPQTKEYGKSESEDLQYSISGGVTPLHLASEGGYAGSVELLLAKGADVNAGSQTPLSYAVRRHYLPVVRLLLAAHANPNAGRYDLPLAVTAFAGEMPVLKLLLANGANPNTNTLLSRQVNYRNTLLLTSTVFSPLFLAVNQHQAEAAAELLQAGTDPNALDPGGLSLLFEALQDAPTLKALLEGGADPNRPDRQGVSPLLQAVFGTNQPAVELLLAHKADPNAARTPDGWNPLLSAAGTGTKSIAELLLKAGAAVNTTNTAGETPLYVAVRCGQRGLAALLLANQADPNAKNNDGWTPLHFAASNGKQELAELLLANKADPNERDNSGRTPLDLAKSQAQSAQGLPPGLPRAYPGGPPVGQASLLNYQLGAPGTPTPAREQEPKPQAMAELLRQHGAVDNLPQLDRITVRRSAIGASGATFTKGAHDWNQFTLLELLAVQYGFLASSPNEGGDSSSYSTVAFASNFGRLPFPDLGHLHISRPAANLKSWQDQVVDLTPVLALGDCAKDMRLGWGDVVEIPEADHPLNQNWGGFSRDELANLKKCLTRKVQVVVKDVATPITLAPRISNLEVVGESPTISPRTPFWLKAVLLQSRLVLISSDLSRVKVTRQDPATGQQREWAVDCSEAGPAPDFWLKDGDRIEVPEKTYGSAAESTTSSPAPAPAATRPRTPAQR
jgi:cytohesin